jgi:hypothetical protein
MSEITGMHELLSALEETLKSADLAKRRKLAEVIRAYEKDLPDEFYWSVGARSPALLHNLMSSIDATCRTISRSRARSSIRLADRKPEGNA